jgi:hypothetical protein
VGAGNGDPAGPVNQPPVRRGAEDGGQHHAGGRADRAVPDDRRQDAELALIDPARPRALEAEALRDAQAFIDRFEATGRVRAAPPVLSVVPPAPARRADLYPVLRIVFCFAVAVAIILVGPA